MIDGKRTSMYLKQKLCSSLRYMFTILCYILRSDAFASRRLGDIELIWCVGLLIIGIYFRALRTAVRPAFTTAGALISIFCLLHLPTPNLFPRPPRRHSPVFPADMSFIFSHVISFHFSAIIDKFLHNTPFRPRLTHAARRTQRRPAHDKVRGNDRWFHAIDNDIRANYGALQDDAIWRQVYYYSHLFRLSFTLIAAFRDDCCRRPLTAASFTAMLLRPDYCRPESRKPLLSCLPA